MALLTADIDEIAVRKDSLEELADKIGSVVTKWNTYFTYFLFLSFSYKKAAVSLGDNEGRIIK